MIKEHIESLLDKHALKFKPFRGYVSSRTTKFGNYDIEFIAENYTINSVIGDYQFYDIRKDDIVLDMGANVGGFSMLVCNSVKQVFAVEPLFTDVLRSNIEKNNITNVEILDLALELEDFDCDWSSREKKNVKAATFTEIREMCGGHIDFLKLDVENAEWIIEPYELDGIRRIEAEVHSKFSERKHDFSDMLESIGYELTIDQGIQDDGTGNTTTMMVHAHREI